MKLDSRALTANLSRLPHTKRCRAALRDTAAQRTRATHVFETTVTFFPRSPGAAAS